MRFPIVSCLLAVALCLATFSASAQLYKWVDESGVVNYGDWPPQGVKFQPISHGTLSSVSAATALSAAVKQPRDTSREQPRPASRGADKQVTVTVAATGSTGADDPEYAGAYAPYYGYPTERAAARDALDSPRVEQPIARPLLPIDPAIPDMPLRPRR